MGELLRLVAFRPTFGLTFRRFRWRCCGLVCRRTIFVNSLSVSLPLMLPRCCFLLRRVLLKGRVSKPTEPIKGPGKRSLHFVTGTG